MSATVTGPPPVGRPPSRWGQLQSRLRGMPRRTLWLNIGLAVLLVAAIIAAFLLIGNPSAPTQVERTAQVTRGTVTSSVTGSGNAASSLSTPVSFQSTGTVLTVDVKPGDTVTLGQTLATIDPASAGASLRTAQAQLDGAKAALAQAQAGPTSVKAQQDALAITQAQQNLATAQKQLDQAHQQQSLDQASTQDAISAAQRKLQADRAANVCSTSTSGGGSSTTTSTSSAPSSRTGNSGSGTPTTSATPTASSQRSNAESSGVEMAVAPVAYVSSSDTCATIIADQTAVTSAQNARNNTLLADQKAITTAQAQVTTETNNVTSAQLAQQADLHPETPDQIAQVQATVDSAQVNVDTAQLGVDNTTLKAPQAGVVLAVNGKVGESSGGSTSSTTTSTTSTSGTANSSSNASSSASSAGSGFVVIANASQLAVTANIAEADAAKIKLGQPAQIAFPATGTTATGTVTQITPQSTVTNNVVLYPITVSVDSAPDGVGVGATASLSIQTASTPDVIQVPTAAITTLGDRHTVTVRRDGQDTVVPIQIGVQGDTSTEVTSGVNVGDTLVLPSATPAASNGVPGGGGAGGQRGGG
jgi:HlyD family secretion protein